MPESKTTITSWHQAVSIVAAGLDPAGPLPEHATTELLEMLERLASRARWRLRLQAMRAGEVPRA